MFVQFPESNKDEESPEVPPVVQQGGVEQGGAAASSSAVYKNGERGYAAAGSSSRAADVPEKRSRKDGEESKGDDNAHLAKKPCLSQPESETASQRQYREMVTLVIDQKKATKKAVAGHR